MAFERVIMPSFAVIGQEGSTQDGDDVIERMWKRATERYDEVAHLARTDGDGTPCGFWGAMTDFGRNFRPWEEGFSQGLYLAGVECDLSAEAPRGWTKWIIPGFEFVKVPCEDENTFMRGVIYLGEHELPLVGAVQDYTCPADGGSYMMFPIRKL